MSYSTRQFAEFYGVEIQRVQQWIANGTLPAIDVSKEANKKPTWRITDEGKREFDRKRSSVRIEQPNPTRQRKEKFEIKEIL